MTTIKSFVERLAKIGIEVELSANYPWIYLEKVNGHNIHERFYSNYGFTVFFSPVRVGQVERITDISKVFNKIREVITFDGELPELLEDDYE